MDETKTTAAEETTEQALTTAQNPAPVTVGTGIWSSTDAMKTAYGMAKVLASSSLVPEGTYRGNAANCLIALEMAQRTGFSPLHVMQNLYVIKGKPSWSGQFCAAAVNASGLFSPLEYIRLVNDDGSTNGYYCKATRLSNNTVCEGTPVTWDMVKGEDWYGKSGSKWKTMPDLMFHYRAAAFFVREHCPEVLCGLQTVEEVQDVKGYDEPKTTKVISFD